MKQITKRTLILAVVAAFLMGAAIATAVCLLALPAPQPAAQPTPSQAPMYSLQWYQQKTEKVKGQPCIEISCEPSPVMPIASADFPGGYGWFYNAIIQETNGVDFQVDNLSLGFAEDGSLYCEPDFTYSGSDVAGWWGSSTIPASGTVSMSGGMPLQQISGVCLVVTGRDASGTEYTFSGYIPLSQEIPE